MSKTIIFLKCSNFLFLAFFVFLGCRSVLDVPLSSVASAWDEAYPMPPEIRSWQRTLAGGPWRSCARRRPSARHALVPSGSSWAISLSPWAPRWRTRWRSPPRRTSGVEPVLVRPICSLLRQAMPILRLDRGTAEQKMWCFRCLQLALLCWFTFRSSSDKLCDGRDQRCT